MKINWLLKFFKYDRSSRNKGFTLTELLVGATISVVVIGAAGYALMESQKSSRAATTQVDARTEANRALTFITDEIKEAKTIADTSDQIEEYIYPKDATKSLLPDEFNPPDKNVRVILALEVPHPTRVGALVEVIYYVRDAESPWIGPKVVYRWGPNFDAKGGYSASTIDDPTLWQHEALIDQIPDGATINTASCLSTDIEVIASDAGFGVCIDETKRSATILLSRIKDQKDWSSSNSNTKNNSIYSTQLKAFARGEDKDGGYSGNTNLTTSTATTLTSPRDPNSNPQPRKTIRLQRLGSSFACSTTGSSTVSTEVTVTKSDSSSKVYTWNYSTGTATENGTTTQVTDIPFDSTAGDVATYTSKYTPSANCTMNSNLNITESITSAQTSTTKVEKIDNGKVFSTSDSEDNRMMVNKYPNGIPVQETVTDLLQKAGFYDSATKTVTIPQQVDGNNYTRFVYAFEMGPSSGNGFNEAGFDYQDNLILVTVAGDSL
jgi:prepilin-type N-terminal cleavage/methylation domain-containing protein